MIFQPHGGEFDGIQYLFLSVIIVVVSFFIASIIYEIIRYRRSTKENESVFTDSSQKIFKIGIITKILSFVFFLISVYLIYIYLRPFFDNYQNVKLLEGIDYKNIYNLNSLSLQEILTSFYAFFLYILIFFSFITLFFSLKNKRFSNIILIITSAIFLFVGIMNIFLVSNIYSNTVYQKGDSYSGSAIDIINTDRAIKEKNISLCNNVKYYYYNKYCKETLSLKNN